MKKMFFVAAMAAVMGLGFTSCSQDDGIANAAGNNPEGNIPGKMEFNAIVGTPGVTRGTAILAANKVANFQVFGFLEDGTQYVGSALNSGIMIDGALGTGADATNYVSWDYRTASDVAYWPQSWVRFQAISPATDASFSIESTAKATGVDFTGYVPAGTEDDGEEQKLTAVVTVPTDQSLQKDIMFAKAASDGATHTSDNNPSVGLTFDHAMSQIVFKGKVASDKIAVSISDIKIMNAKAEGKVGYFGTNQALAAATTGYANTDYSIGLVAAPTLGAANVAEAKDLSATDGALFMLPQTVSAWTTTAGSPVTVAEADGTSSKDGQGILAITCHITSAGQDLVGTSSADETVYIPFGFTWAQGKKYIYTLVFGKGTGAYDEEGEPLDTMLPITYTVSTVNGWDAITPDDIEF
jgi:hypothetical protein